MSFPAAVITEVSVAKDKHGSAILFLLNLTTSSAAICCASDALPPLPAIKIFFFYEATYIKVHLILLIF